MLPAEWTEDSSEYIKLDLVCDTTFDLGLAHVAPAFKTSIKQVRVYLASASASLLGDHRAVLPYLARPKPSTSLPDVD